MSEDSTERERITQALQRIDDAVSSIEGDSAFVGNRLSFLIDEAVKSERESCALVADAVHDHYKAMFLDWATEKAVTREIAFKIRARGEKP